MLHAGLCTAGNNRWDPVRPLPTVARRSCRGSKASAVSGGFHFKSDQQVVADRILGRGRLHLE
eukprot:7896052-Alexandrium_andersonii.AAC.1